jgi:hypothetical protein
MGIGKPRPESSESMEEKVVEKSPKGRFHRVCVFLLTLVYCLLSSIVDSGVVHIKQYISHSIMTPDVR